MKKLIAKGLVIALSAFTLCACGEKSDDAGDKEPKKENIVKVIDVELTEEQYAFGVDKDQPELLASVNAYIKEIKGNGKFDEICSKYFGNGQPTPITSAKLDTSKDQLKVATNAAFEPFEYTEGDTYYGIDMEIAAGLAQKLGKELVIQNMDFDAVCLSVGQHKSDVAMAGLTIKEDRKKYVDFSDSYYDATQKVIVRTDNKEFDSCKDKAAIDKILETKDKGVKVGVQSGTTGQFYCEGDKSWGSKGFKMTTVPYKNGSLAVQDLINGNVNLVIIDSAPAKCITDAFNEMY